MAPAEGGTARTPADICDRLRLDPTSGVPTYLQLVQQVERLLRLGHLKLGDQLPKVDTVASLAIRMEPQENYLGFRLDFTLTTNGSDFG